MKRLLLLLTTILIGCNSKEYVDISTLDSGQTIIPTRYNGKIGWVLASDNDKVVIPFDFDDAVFWDDIGHYFHTYGYSSNTINYRIILPTFLRKGDKWGVIDNTGKELLPFEYEVLESPNNSNYILVDKNGKRGICYYVDCAFYDFLVPCEYENVELVEQTAAEKSYEKRGISIIVDSNSAFFVKKNGKYGVYRWEKTVIPCLFDSIRSVEDEYDTWIKKGEKKEITIQNNDDTAQLISYVDLMAYKNGKKYFFSDLGELVPLPNSIDSIYKTSGIIKFRENHKWRLISKGTLSPLILDSINETESFSKLFVYVYKDGKQTVLNSDFKLLVPWSKYCQVISGIVYEKHKYTPSKEKNNSGLDPDIRLLLSQTPHPVWKTIVLYKNYNTNKWGIVDIDNKQILPCIYDRIRKIRITDWDNEFFYNNCYYRNNLLMVRKNKKWGMINMKGDFITKLQYDNFDNSAWDQIKVSQNGKWGVIDTSGHSIIPCKYSEIEFWPTLGIIKTQYNKKYGTCDTDGKTIIPCLYDKMELLFAIPNTSHSDSPALHNEKNSKLKENSLIKIQLNDKWGLIDLKGNQIIPCKFDDIEVLFEETKTEYHKERFDILFDEPTDESRIKVCYNNKWGVIDINGNIIVPCIYDKLDLLTDNSNENRIKVCQNGKWKALDKNGEMTFARSYYDFDDILKKAQKDMSVCQK